MIGTIITIASIAIIGIILWLFARIHHWTGRALRAERQLDHPQKTQAEQSADALAVISNAGLMPVVEKLFDKYAFMDGHRVQVEMLRDRLMKREPGEDDTVWKAGHRMAHIDPNEYRAAMDVYKERQYRARAETAEAKLAKLAKEDQGS